MVWRSVTFYGAFVKVNIYISQRLSQLFFFKIHPANLKHYSSP